MMRPLQLDFVRAPARRAALVCVLLALSGLGVAIALAWQAQAAQQRVQALQAHVQSLGRRLARAAPPGPRLSAAETERQLARANQVIEQLAVPWGELFRAFEAADAPGVGLLSLVPNGAEGSVRLSGESASLPQLLAYLDRLGAQPALDQVHLLAYETIERDGRNLVSFTIAARWHKSS